MASAVEESSGMEHKDTHLQMDYWSEPLSVAQNAYYAKAEREYNEIMAKISNFISNEKGTVLEQGSEVLVLQGSPGMAPGVSVLSSVVTPASQVVGAHPKARLIPLQPPSQQMPALQAVSSQQLVIQSGTVPAGARVARATQGQAAGTFQTSQGTIQLVMDPRLGLIAIPNQQSSGNQIIKTTPVSQPSVTQPPAPIQAQPAPLPAPSVQPIQGRGRPRSVVKTSTNTTPSPQAQGSVSSTATVTAPKPVAVASKPTAVAASKPGTVPTPKPTSVPTPKPSKGRISTPTAQLAQTTIPTSSNRPTENNSVGGLCAGNPSRRNFQEEVKSSASGPDSKEVTFNKLAGKTFPSLVVLARPHLRVREMTQSKTNQERSSLDSKVKCVLMYTATKFSEWLIQQGIVRSDQYCTIHKNPDGQFRKLKLGMYSDVTKFPFSGGYVWVSECCPQRFVSLFSGSIFEGAPHPPTVLLKLMYHWCCQTNVQNVIQWVKVDNFYVKNFFTHMRSVCIAAVHEKHEKLGGPQKKVEVGVISLGTTSQDGNMRQVKVEVLGVMDAESKLVRLRAVEPLQDGERNYKRRFVKILEPLRHWVHKDSIILTDFTVDKGTLMSMGFSQVHQSTIPDPPSTSNKMSNQSIMEYLRRIVPRMFQNTLSLLSRQIIQQFLDELVWRERWGPVPSQAFDTLVSHLASQSKLDTGESLVTKLSKIAANPFRCWQYDYWKCDGLVIPEPTESSPGPSIPVTPSTVGKAKGSKGAGSLYEGIECHPSIALTKKYEFKTDLEVEKRITEALHAVHEGKSIRTVVDEFKVPRSVLLERARHLLSSKRASGQAVFLDEEEEDIREHLLTVHDWGYPIGRWDIRLAVKQYLDTFGRIEHRFKDNFPGDMWIERFLSRHPPIRHKLCRSLPTRGAHVEPDSVKTYILNLSSLIQVVPQENIVNFMEIGLNGDPLKSMAVELRDLRYPVGKRKVKSTATIMIACTALGHVLPSYIVFDGQPVVVNQGKFAGEYYSTKSGWFDETAFEYWLETVIFPWADGLEGKKLLIGDNLAQLFTLKTLALCMDKNITFVCMPCNVSGILSPLDVVLCDKLRAQWKTQSRQWAATHSDKFITREEFPLHIYELLTSTLGPEMPELIRTAFKVIGLCPFNTKNTMKALENGGVSMNDKNHKQTETKGNKRKRIYIGVDDASKKKAISNSAEIEEVVIEDGDNEDELSAVKEALNSGKDLVSLDPYYYGTRDPHKLTGYSETKYNLSLKCPLCQSSVPDNITLMKHLLGHSETLPTLEEMSDIHLCKYCAQKYTSLALLDKHVWEAHVGLCTFKNACRICCDLKTDKENLILHMHKTHTKLELPYMCSICGFSSSEHYKLVDHFYETHAGGEKMQCPFCLKCVAVSNNGKKMPANVFFFMHHVRKHLSSTVSRKCPKCTLSFVHKGIMKEHLLNDHRSFCDFKDVIAYDIISIMMPTPKGSHVPVEEQTENIPNFTRLSLINVIMKGLMPSFQCLECHSNLDEGNHFVDFMSCMLCSFSTCCGVSIKKHLEVFHSKSRPVHTNPLPAELLLPEEMHCMCGFETRDGNILAKHLTNCLSGSGTAFPCASSAHAAAITSPRGSYLPSTFPKLKTHNKLLDGQSEQCTKELSDESSQGNELKQGLSRKTSVDENVERLASETYDVHSKERPSSRASNSSSSSNSRKRNARTAGLDSPDILKTADKEDNTKKACLNQNAETLESKSGPSDHLEGVGQSEVNQATTSDLKDNDVSKSDLDTQKTVCDDGCLENVPSVVTNNQSPHDTDITRAVASEDNSERETSRETADPNIDREHSESSETNVNTSRLVECTPISDDVIMMEK